MTPFDIIEIGLRALLFVMSAMAIAFSVVESLRATGRTSYVARVHSVVRGRALIVYPTAEGLQLVSVKLPPHRFAPALHSYLATVGAEVPVRIEPSSARVEVIWRDLGRITGELGFVPLRTAALALGTATLLLSVVL